MDAGSAQLYNHVAVQFDNRKSDAVAKQRLAHDFTHSAVAYHYYVAAEVMRIRRDIQVASTSRPLEEPE
jgi:hypothetical protein